ncbi:MAG TPA: hypothetical protein VFU23_14325 [Gemmatimonadales bacterium]|nr:hypothetical protein [Gemmatimonadales bacterium]
MTQSVVHVTIAGSSGGVWLALVVHFGSALVALVAGFIAIAVAKGGRWHRRSGTVFVVGMIAAGLFAAGIAMFEAKLSLVIGGLFTAYLVLTAYTTVRPPGGDHRHRLNVALAALAFPLALIQLAAGFLRLQRPPGMLNGPPAPMIFFLGTVTLLAAVGDVRLIRAGDIRGARRIARHLWRMCFGLFIASGSFFLGQMQFIPAPLRIMPLLGALAVAPLFILVYWMWRVRFRQKIQGMQIRRPIPTSPGS